MLLAESLDGIAIAWLCMIFCFAGFMGWIAGYFKK
jgi:hypothetical protein